MKKKHYPLTQLCLLIATYFLKKNKWARINKYKNAIAIEFAKLGYKVIPLGKTEYSPVAYWGDDTNRQEMEALYKKICVQLGILPTEVG